MQSVRKLCGCKQFSEFDPTDEIPIGRDTFKHYVEHGPIQPNQTEIRKTADKTGRIFQSSWYVSWSQRLLAEVVPRCLVCLFGPVTALVLAV